MAIALTGAFVFAAAGVAGAAPPQAQSMVLPLTDFPAGAIVSAQAVTPASGLPQRNYLTAYSRSFSGAVVSSTPLITAVSSGVVMKSQSSASAYMTVLIRSLQSSKGRKGVLDVITKGFSALGKTTTTSFRRDRTLRLGNAALDVDITIKAEGATVDTGQLYVQEGQSIGYFAYASAEPGLSGGRAFALAKKVAAQMKAASGSPPANSNQPIVSGTLSLGQILTAEPGSWSAPAPTFAYQWFRCTAAGTGCVAIPGATDSAYTVSTADQGSTLAFSTAATNPAGTTLVMSAPSAVVP